MFRKTGLITLMLFLALPYGRAANCEVVKYATTIDIINGKITKTDTIIIRIINRSGEDYGEVSINYSRDNPVLNLDAWILDRNGNTVRYIRKNEISEINTVSSSFYTDYFTKKFTLKHNQYPYYVAYTYQSSEKQYLSVAYWHPVIALDVPTLSATLTFRHPENFKVNIIQNQINNPEILSSSGIITHRWTAVYDGNLRQEVFCPAIEDFLPSVQIIPFEFEYGIRGSMSSWQSFGEWQNRLNEDLDELPDAEKKRIQNKIINLYDKREIVKVLYHYLQDYTRYVNVQIGIGGLKPYPASYVAHNKFGDCKALSIFMKALLKFAEIESFYALVDADEAPGKFYHDIPFQQFNHAMIAVPIENDTIWLENTNSCLPFGYYGVFTQNRPALLIDGNNSRLVKIPPLQPENVITGRKIQFDIKYNGATSIDAEFIYKGADFEVMNNLLMNYSKEDQDERIHHLLPFPAFDMHDWKMEKRNRDADHITLTVSADINQIVNPIDDKYYFSFQQSGLPNFETPQARRLPVHIPYPIVFNDTLIYKLPTGNKFVEVPDDKLIESRFGRYSIKFVNRGGLLTICREILLKPVMTEHGDYSDLYYFISSVKSYEKQKILFQ